MSGNGPSASVSARVRRPPSLPPGRASAHQDACRALRMQLPPPLPPERAGTQKKPARPNLWCLLCGGCTHAGAAAGTGRAVGVGRNPG